MITPEIEKMLLNGSATYHRESIGLAGTSRINCPKGANLIITGIEFLPFMIKNQWTWTEPFDNLEARQNIEKFGSFTYNGSSFSRYLYQCLLNIDNLTTNAFFFKPTYDYSIADGTIERGLPPTPFLQPSKYDTFFILKKFASFTFIFPTFNVGINSAPIRETYIDDRNQDAGPLERSGEPSHLDNFSLNISVDQSEFPEQDYMPRTTNSTNANFLPSQDKSDFIRLLPRRDNLGIGNVAFLQVASRDRLNSTAYLHWMPVINLEYVIVTASTGRATAGI